MISRLKFICAFTSKWNSSNHESGWSFYPENFENIISVEKILIKIEKLRNEILGPRFFKKEKLKLATFYLLYTSNFDDHVSEENALQLLEKWKKDVIQESSVSF